MTPNMIMYKEILRGIFKTMFHMFPDNASMIVIEVLEEFE